jgi:GWxTD domain-containing protein
MKSIIFFVLIVFTFGNINGQIENKGLYTPQKVKYYSDYLNFMNDDGKSRVDMFIHVPFQEIQFIRTAKGYEGGYSVTISLYSEGGETLLLEKMWSEKIETGSFEDVSSIGNYNISYRSIQLEPGKYLVKTTVMDKDSRKEFVTSKDFIVKDFSVKPAISDIMLVSQKTEVEGQNKIVPNVTGNISGSTDGINIYFELYSDSLAAYNIDYIINKKSGEELYSNTGEQQLNKNVTKISYNINDLELGLGKYTLILNLRDENGEIVASNTREFYSRWKGLPSMVDDIDKVISQVLYIAAPDEMSYMQAGENEEEKTKRFIDFWKAKDPSPGNDENEVFDEYFSRVTFANENFSHYLEGWRSDRGMVFITLGTPNNIDRHPFEYDSKPYEVWQYYELNRSFTFVDQTGFGDYRLITPLYGDMFRYRY